MDTLATQFASLLTIAQSSGSGDAGAAAGGIFSMLCCCGTVVLSIAFLGFWIWMLVDCCTKTFPGENDKMIWVLVIALTGIIGAAVYYFVGRPKGTKA